MAEPGRAPTADAARLNININAQYDSNISHGNVDNGGQVYFNCAPTGGALIFTSPADAFNGETNGYLTLAQGNNGPFTPSQNNFVIGYCCCAPGSACAPEGIAAGGGYSIAVGNPPMPGKHKEEK